jgi:deoxyribodipyrimidine photo-lyase
MPVSYLFKPWEAPEPVLKEAGVILGQTYPRPIVDLVNSRKRALKAFSDLSKKAG